MKQRITLILLLVTLSSYPVCSQFTLQAELRNRSELRDGYKSLSETGSIPALLIWQRSRISFRYQTDQLRLVFTPQDVRLWGSESMSSSTGVQGDDASIELFEAYMELKLTEGFWLSLGRQALNYDNQRLLAARNWNNYGLTYDALLLKINAANWNIHTGITWNSKAEASSGNVYPSNRIKNLNFLWANREISSKLKLSLLHISSGVTVSDTVSTLQYKHTSGLYSSYTADRLQCWTEAYYQYGRSNTGKKVNAFMFAADAGYKLGSFIPGAGLSYLSGNRSTEALANEQLFDILYGARHRFYGYMDYFRDFRSHTAQGGLKDYYIYLGIKLSKSVNLTNSTHFFSLAQVNPSTPVTKDLGIENDLVFKYKFSQAGQLECGYLFYIPSTSLSEIQGVEDPAFSQFLYLQITFTPVLFKQELPQN